MAISIETLALAKQYTNKTISEISSSTIAGLTASVQDGVLVFEENKDATLSLSVDGDTLVLE